MTDVENDGEETVILTRRDRRRGGAVAEEPPTQPEPTDGADVVDVVDEDAGAADSTDGTDADALDDATVVVDRSAGPVQEPADSLDDATVVVDRSAGRVEEPAGSPDADVLDEATVVVDRSAGAAEEPGDTSDEQLVEEATVVVSRPPRRLRRKRAKGADEQDDASVDPAPTAAPMSFEAPTDGPAPEIYRPRPAPLGPSAPPVVVGAAAPTRAVDPDLPSVAKQGLRWSMATLLAFAAACAVSVAGLVTLGFVVFA
ncbi:hypothetical protein [Microbacterium sp. LWH13-1.2]|uniref:hypothetical protein n=1 Tax=Microbacterium sp. LWH13-1.2 TaxID=3135260 RepID=UPI003138E1C8